MSESHFLYIIGKVDDDGEYLAPIKVGITGGLTARLKTIQTAAPFKLEIFGAFAFPTKEWARKMEREFHRCMSGVHLHGEWFDAVPLYAFAFISANVRRSFEAAFSGDELVNALEASGVNAAERVLEGCLSELRSIRQSQHAALH